MVAVLRWVILVLVLSGNIVFWIHCFNRINATGLPRRQIKRIEKVVVIACFLLPGLIAWRDWAWIVPWLVDRQPETLVGSLESDRPWASMAMACFGLASLLWHAPAWLHGRIRLNIPPKALVHTTRERFDLRKHKGHAIYAKPWIKALGTLPGNQLHLIETTCHDVRVPRLATVHQGLRIGHFSDVHLTGSMHFGFYREAVVRLMSTKPDIVLLSGDLIDYESCLNQVQPLLEEVEARLGCYFVLGNHDRRLKDVARLRSMLVEMGWHDLGAQARSVEHAAEEIYFIGCERPWFDSPHREAHERNTAVERAQAALRIGVSHSPDQIDWARSLDLDLLFCGHTHGGQVRLPWIGPMIAPSHYGSRYASGWFHCPPTLMHVSRGISGTYPLRVACAPEVSSIVLRMPCSKSKL